MADLKYYDVILRPVITEKSMGLMGEKKYTFYVHPDATKTQVKDAVERLFEGTKVASVNTMNCGGKLRRRSSRACKAPPFIRPPGREKKIRRTKRNGY